MEASTCAQGKRPRRFAPTQAKPLAISQEEAWALADAYAFLAISLKLPSSGLSDLLRNGQVAESVESMASDLARLSSEPLAARACESFENAQGNDRAKLSALREAYTILFTNPLGTQMRNHEAQFLYFLEDPDADAGLSPRMFVNPSALSVERIVKKAGLSRSSESNESADHIATEMELMSRLFAEKAHLIEEGASEDSGKPDEAASDAERALDTVIREFCFYHCSKWHEAFFEQLSKTGVHDFFDGVGHWGRFVTRALMGI